MMVTIARAALDEMQAHARSTYPEECCGLVLEHNGEIEVIRVTNVQNQMHAQDPERYPRNATTAYSMGEEAAPALLAVQRGEAVLRAIYHSHPEHDAYFSAEDRAQALGGWDEPMYPDVAWLVLSVRDREVVDTKVFAWDTAAGEFAAVSFEVR